MADIFFKNYAFTAAGSDTNAGGLVTRTMPDRLADVINVLDYGADNTGTNGCGAAIQSALNAAYGPYGNSNSDNSHNTLNKAVYFPAGTYLVDQQLLLGLTNVGVCLFGDGQRATRLLYTGPDSLLPFPADGVTSLIFVGNMIFSEIRSITFDMTGSSVTSAVGFRQGYVGGSGGTGNTWYDCGFVGGSYGMLVGDAATGDEGNWWGCRFVNNSQAGHFVSGGNCLNYILGNCTFDNCNRGVFETDANGGGYVIKGCRFRGSTTGDIIVQGIPGVTVDGCYSESVNFCNASGTVTSCFHNAASNGSFLDSANASNNFFVLDGNHSVKGTLTSHSGADKVYLRGNTFDRAGVVTNWTGGGGVLGQNI